jgi:hypothetical protein
MTKAQIVANHLKKYGSISQLEAQSNYNIWRLAAEVHRLRTQGIAINMRMKKAPSGARYAEYSLDGQ